MPTSRPAPPNILWLVCEDINPQLGCYGDRYADTPNLDRLAARSFTYLNCWSNAPVCAPARTTIITGVYPTALGAEHMRSMVPVPTAIRFFPWYLRQRGYYTTNNAKTDYNACWLDAHGTPHDYNQGLAQRGTPDDPWNECSGRAHYHARPAGKPFYSVFNHEVTHESGIRRPNHKLVHDPARAPLPAYHPDTPEVRHDWAQYYDNITTMDAQIGAKLEELEREGLADDTIVFFYGDNGGGMPRSKRWPYNSGNHVPLLVYVPDRYRELAPTDYRPGGKTDRLVGFVDLAPTVLSLAGIQAPRHMQGHAFMGPHAAASQPYVHGFRGRMDERYDMVRTVRDKRYLYARNYMPHLPYGQHLAYQWETPTTRAWEQLHQERKLTPVQDRYWQPKPSEELYDLERDPDEVANLASSPEHRDVLERLRRAQREHAVRTRDVGFLPEAEIHARAAGSTPCEMGRDDARYPLPAVMAAAELASSRRPDLAADLRALLGHADAAVRYWAAVGLLIRGKPAVEAARPALEKALADSSLSVRVAAARALAEHLPPGDAAPSLAVLVELADVEKHGLIALAALNAIDALGSKAAAVHSQVERLPRRGTTLHTQRATETMGRLFDHILGEPSG